MMLVNNATMDAFGICIYGILVLSVACRETVQEDLVSLQLSVNIWATTDFPEAAKPTQESGSSQRMSKSLSHADRRTRCVHKIYFVVSSPLYSTIAASSAEQFSTCMAISMINFHLPPSKGSIPPGDISRASLTPVSWLSLCLAPPPSCQHPHKTEVRAARLSWHRRAGQYAGDCHSPNAHGDKILVPWLVNHYKAGKRTAKGGK